jgi:hypothetical protein
MMSNQTEEADLYDGRTRRIETRLTRLMLAMGVDPGYQYNLAESKVKVNITKREVILPNLTVSLIDCANVITAEGGDLKHSWSLVLQGQTLGVISFVR